MAGYVDVETLLIAWIKAKLGFVNVTDELPTNLVDLIRTDPVIVVERFGGADAVPTLDVARVDIDVYANSRSGAKTHAETIRVKVRTQLPRYVYSGSVVSKTATLSAPTVVPYDSRNSVRHCAASYQVHLHQFAGI